MRTDLTHTSFHECDLREAVFDGAHLDLTSFSGSNLSGAVLRCAAGDLMDSPFDVDGSGTLVGGDPVRAWLTEIDAVNVWLTPPRG